MAAHDVLIEIVDRDGATGATSVDYMPFSIKVIKLRVRRGGVPGNRPALGPIWIHPANYIQADGDSPDPNRWQIFGTADDDPDLWVAWGAGDEQGFCAKTKDKLKFIKDPAPLDDDEDHFIYLHLIHRPIDFLNHVPAPKTLTLIATSEKPDHTVLRDGAGNVQSFGELRVDLKVPAAATNPVRARWSWDVDAGLSTITFGGAPGQPSQLPRYVSRWWPASQVDYDMVDQATSDFLAKLKITYQRRVNGSNRSQVDVFHDTMLVARITGDLGLPLHDYRQCSFEVARFPDDHHVVVRLWFYWVTLKFTVDQLMTFVPVGKKSQWRPRAQALCRRINGGLLPWRQREEAPDIERFDLVLTPGLLASKHVGSDIHWREYWATVDWDAALRAKIASIGEVAQVVKQGQTLPEIDPPPFDPLANGLCDLVNEGTGLNCPHRGAGRVVEAAHIRRDRQYIVCAGCSTHFFGQEQKAAGMFWAKHAPLPENVTPIQNAVSTNVLDG